MKRKIESLVVFLSDIITNRVLLYSLAVNEIKVRYMGSYLGILWAFINPIVTIGVMWFVFSVGFRAMPVDNFPFILWLVSGMIPWFFIVDAVSSSAYSVVENSYLVKKVVFRVSLLPLIKVLSALFIHGFFIIFMLFMFFTYGHYPTLHIVQIGYYLFAACCLIVGFSFATSAIVVFFRDMGQIISMVLQVMFWGTPIFWSFAVIPAKYQFLFYLNPFYYIIQGYRDALVNKIWFWHHPLYTLYFWSITALIFSAGATIFKKLKPHFADVL